MRSSTAFVPTPGFGVSLYQSNSSRCIPRSNPLLRLHRKRAHIATRRRIPECTQKMPNAPPTEESTIQDEEKEMVDSFTPSPLPRTLRWVMGALSLTGCIETAYLTFIKLFSTPGSICGTQGCLDVLTGPWSSVLGIPLSAFGFLAYGSFCFLSIWPLFATEEEVYLDVDAGTTTILPKDEVYARRDRATRALLSALSAALAVFSSYLMALLIWVIRDMCPYCVYSAILATTLFLTTVFARAAAPKVAASGAALAIAAAGLSFALAAPGIPPVPDTPQSPPQVTEKSSSEALRIARKLRSRNTKMYGAYWCTHCYDQKQRLGKRAWKMLQYVECDRYGANSQMKLCRQKRIPGYPTWEIDGKLYPGEIKLEDLEMIADEE